MSKIAKTITLDEELVKYLEQDAENQHLEFSSRLNQILHKYMKENIKEERGIKK